MIWIIILIVILAPVLLLLLAPFEIIIDTRVPVIKLHWSGIGNAAVVYESDEWWLKIRVFFFGKKWTIMHLILPGKKKKKAQKEKAVKKKERTSHMSFSRAVYIIKSFTVTEWKMAMSSSDYTTNARLYFLNFIPYTRQHLFINFTDQNYLVIVARNNVWRIAYAFIKK